MLTAAHCVLARSVRDMSLVISQSNLDANAIVLRKISQIVIHPQYDAREFANDIALLRLESPAPIEPLPLFKDFSDSRLEGLKASVYGWGLTYILMKSANPFLTAVDSNARSSILIQAQETFRQNYWALNSL